MTQKITACLWFEKDCEAAMNYYVQAFNEAPHSRKISRINFIQRYEKGIETPGAAEMEGKVLTGEFELDGQRFLALDGGPVDTPGPPPGKASKQEGTRLLWKRRWEIAISRSGSSRD